MKKEEKCVAKPLSEKEQQEIVGGFCEPINSESILDISLPMPPTTFPTPNDYFKIITVI